MTNTMSNLTLIALCSSLSLAACATNSSGTSSKENAGRAFESAVARLDKAQDQAARSNAHVAPISVGIDYAGPCELGGTMKVKGTADTANDGSKSSFDLTTELSGCVDDDGQLDGTVYWILLETAAAYTASISGQMSWLDAADDATCDFSVTLHVDAQGATYSGTVCGYAVSDLQVAAPALPDLSD